MEAGINTARTINCVTFTGDPAGAGPLLLGSGTVAFGNLGSTFGDYWTAAAPSGNAAYAAALDSGRFGPAGNGTITLGGLVLGKTYLVQLWITDTRSGANTRVRTVDGVSTTSGGPNNIATGIFVADAATQVITLADAGSFGPQLNLLQVRDVPFLVFNTADSGPGSLRQAIADAIAAPGADTITLAPALSGQTITLAASSGIVFTGTDAIMVDASALASPVTMDGNNSSRLFRVAAGADVTLKNLVLTRGNGVSTTASGSGGAIYSQGTLTVEDCVFTNNAVTSNGGAIVNASGTLTVTRCTFTGNSAGTTTQFGGAIHNIGPTTATITRSTFSGNSAFRGGAVRGQNASLNISQCTFTGNTASGGGGALSFGGTGTVALSHLTVTGNHATGTASFSGGGIQNDQNASFTLANSIVSGNTATTGAADIDNQDPLTYVGANLVQNVVNSGTGSVTGPAPIATAPLLAALGNYGGPTQTMPPVTNSPAIDAASGSTITTDQRGVAITSGNPDIGASENIVPTISNIVDLTVLEDSAAATRTVAFTIGNTLASATVSATSSNTTLVPSFTFGGTDANRTVLLNVPANAYGSSTITVTVSNGPAIASDAFLFTVNPVNDPPSLNAIGNFVLSPGAGLQNVTLNGIGTGAANEAQTLTVTAISSNPAFLPHPTVTYTSPAATGSIGFTPASGQVGFSQVTVTVSDGDLTISRSFYFAVAENTGNLVSHPLDSGPGSLRNVIASAIGQSGNQTITFHPALSGQTIILSSEIEIDDPASADLLTIDATSLPGGITIDGGPGSNRIFTLATGGQAAFHGLTLTGGNGTDPRDVGGAGGAIDNQGTLLLAQCTLSGNSVSSGTSGGAIYNSGTLTVKQCTLSGNSGGTGGGAISNNSGTLILEQCTLSGNSATDGGAIQGSGTLTMTRCTVSGNTAAFSGSALANSGPLSLTQYTVSGNTVTFPGFGISAISTSTGALTLTNCIIAGNLPATLSDISSGDSTITRSGHNLIGNNSGVSSYFPSGLPNSYGDYVGTSTSPLNPQLSSLANNGGPTQTMRLLPGSPALNRISSPSFTIDQRGFPIVGLADIGAYENGGISLAPIAPLIMLGDTTAQFTITPFNPDDVVLTPSGTSDNARLLPPGSITFSPSGATRTISLSPATGQIGTATVTLTVNSISTSFLLTVLPNTPYNA